MGKKKYPIVQVRWVDSGTLGGWTRKLKGATGSDVRCATAGYLVHDGKKRLCLALNTNDQGQVGEVISIPRGAVRRVKTLKKRKR